VESKHTNIVEIKRKPMKKISVDPYTQIARRRDKEKEIKRTIFLYTSKMKKKK
jgi:hypothetical protein